MKKRIISIALMAMFLLALVPSFAMAEPLPPNVYQVGVTRVVSWASGTSTNPVVDDFQRGSTNPSTAGQHHKEYVEISVTQMGYEKSSTPLLDGQAPTRIVGVEYIDEDGNPTQQGHLIDGFIWTYAFENVATSDAFSTFTCSVVGANNPWPILGCSATINWAGGTTQPVNPFSPDLSTLTIDYLNEGMSGAQDGVPYEYRTGSVWTPVVAQNGSFPLPSIITSNPVTLYVRAAETEEYPASDPVIFSLPARGAAPASSAVSMKYLDPSYPNKMVLTGLGANLQYATDDGYVNGDGSPITFDYADSTRFIYIRYAPTETKPASSPLSFQPLTTGVVPSGGYDMGSESFSVWSGREVSINGGAYVALTSESNAFSGRIDNLATGESLTLLYRSPATVSAPPTKYRTFVLSARQPAPTGVVYNASSATVTGTDSTMQYRKKGDANWLGISGASLNVDNLISGSGNVILEIRKAPTSKTINANSFEYTSASIPTEVVIDQAAGTPDIQIDYINEVLRGFESGISYQYRLNSGSWQTLTPTNGTFSIVSTSFISSTSTVKLEVRKAASGGNPASGAIMFDIPKREAAPTTPALVYNDSRYPDKAVLTGLDSTMEYRIGSTAAYTKASGTETVFDVPTSGNTIYVRLAATATKPASIAKSISYVAKGAAPSSTLNINDEAIIYVTTSMEIRRDGGAYQAITGTTYPVSDMINSISSGTVTIGIRTKATASAPASHERIITLYPRAAAPTGISYNASTVSLTGVSATMQYKLSTDTAWTNSPNSSLSVQNIMSSTESVIVQVRYKAVANSKSASLPVSITLPSLPAAPSNLILDLEREVIKGLEAGTSYQYSTNLSSWINCTVANNEFSIVNLISSGGQVTLYLRKSAIGGAPASSPAQFTIAKRPTAPTSIAINCINPSYPDKITFTGLMANMEYNNAADTVWKPIPSDNYTLAINPPTSNVLYNFRYKGSGSTISASANKSILAYAPVNTGGALDTINERINSVSASMEMRINNGSYQPVTSTTIDVKDMINGIASGTISIKLRNKATQTNPASIEKEILLYKRAATPAGITYNSSTRVVSGVSSSMQYRKVGASSWTNISSTTLNVASFVGSSIEIINKAVANTSSNSLPYVLAIS